MKIRPWATFTSDLPDDQIEDEHDILQYGGKSVAEAIGAILTGLGCVVDPVRYADEHGWELDFAVEKRRLWCQVTIIEGYVIVLEDVTFSLLKKLHPVYVDILTRLAQALECDPRFHDVQWFHADDVMTDAPGSKTPVSVD